MFFLFVSIFNFHLDVQTTTVEKHLDQKEKENGIDDSNIYYVVMELGIFARISRYHFYL